MTENINLAELLHAMEQASVQDSGGYTVRELRQTLNISEKRCVEFVRQAITQGRLRVGRKRITDIAGRPQTVPAYEPIPTMGKRK